MYYLCMCCNLYFRCICYLYVHGEVISTIVSTCEIIVNGFKHQNWNLREHSNCPPMNGANHSLFS